MRKNKNILVLAPHPDDETLGCGGSILKHVAEGANVFWCIFTTLSKSHNYFKEREKEILKVSKSYKFKKIYKMNFLTAKLDSYSKDEIINELKKVIKSCKPSLIYCPFSDDAHSDHRIVHESMAHFGKSFRYKFIKEIRLYETISETENSILLHNNNFNPNLWVDISKFIKKKLQIFGFYKTEGGKSEFPRSRRAITSLSTFRGTAVNRKHAESFMIIKKIIE